MNVLITGVSKGIGSSLLQLMLNDDSIKKIYACSSQEVLNFQKSDKIQYIHLDFLIEDTWGNLNSIINDSPIHILINNAGYLLNNPFKQTSEQELRNVFEVNFFAPYKLIQILLPNLIKGKAHVVNIGSMGGFQGSSKFPGLSAYSSSKAALANLTECLASELSSDKIKFNCLALGAVDTEMLQKAFPDYKSGLSSDEIAKTIKDFAINWGKTMNGKVVPLSLSTP